MKITELFIRNFKSIRHLCVKDIDNALIFVGKNSTGKTVILDALAAVAGLYRVTPADFQKDRSNIEICITLEITTEDLHRMNHAGIISRYKHFDRWYRDFCDKLPGFHDQKLSFIWTQNHDGTIRYQDEFSKDNHYIPQLLPRFFFLDHNRNLDELQQELYLSSCMDELSFIQDEKCIFDKKKTCQKCFQCVGALSQKMPESLTIPELIRLLEYRLQEAGKSDFSRLLNENFYKNSGYTRKITAKYRLCTDSIFQPDISVYDKNNEFYTGYNNMSAGMKSLYALSLLETYVEENKNLPFVIMIEDPELFLHPQLQKNACEILSRLSKKNQVIFSTHSPNMLFNFNSKQIRQVYLDKQNHTVVNPKTDIDYILNDLGYTANDLLNVSFVFFVEGKQDRSRLPLLLQEHYSEMTDDNGAIKRISIITTNSCTNIKTYANLKYMNQLYMKDQFLMIRDSDGKDPDVLRDSLCKYYKGREIDDKGYLPKVTPKNVLILKYYSFENYFLDPEVMTQIGVIRSPEDFYRILFEKYQEYLKNISSMKHFEEVCKVQIQSPEDIRKHLEEIRIYVRGHNLYNIFYGKYKGDAETQILKEYIRKAPRTVFQDILDAVDSFVYFDNRKKK